MKLIFVPAVVGLFASLVLCACSSDSTSGALDPGDGKSDGIGGGGGGGTDGLRPSGALYQIINIYDPLTAAPGKVDIYPKAYALDGDKSLLSIDYGVASALYDPPVYDGGNMFVSMYAAGTNGNGNAVMSQTETLKGGEAITVVLSTGPNKDANGRSLGQSRSYFHDSANHPVAAGTGQLVVDLLGLDNILPEKKEQQFTVKVGDQCLASVDDTEFTKSLLTPGTAGRYALAPGAYTASVIEGEGCAGTPAVENVPVTIEADGRALLVVYAVRGAGYRSVSVPLSPKRAP